MLIDDPDDRSKAEGVLKYLNLVDGYKDPQNKLFCYYVGAFEQACK